MAQAYAPEVGWALGDGQEHGDDPSWDAAKADALYDLLEREVIPDFYYRNRQRIPTAWVARIREGMAELTARLSANRAVRESTERHSIPTAAAFRERAVDKGTVTPRGANWQHAPEPKRAALRFGGVKVMRDEGRHVFEAEAILGGLDPTSVWVERYADGVNGPSRNGRRGHVAAVSHSWMQTATSLVRQCPRDAHLRTMRRKPYRGTTALPSPWRPLESCGRADSISKPSLRAPGLEVVA